MLSKCKVFVQRAHAKSLGHHHHFIIEMVRDGAAILQSRKTGCRSRPETSVDGIVIKEGSPPAAPGRIAAGQHLITSSKTGVRKVAVRPGFPHQFEQWPGFPFPGADFGYQLLRQDVPRCIRNDDPVQQSVAHGLEQRHLPTRSSRVTGNSLPFGVSPTAWPARPTRWMKAEMLPGEPIWQTRSTWPMSMPSSSEAVATRARKRPDLSACSASSRCSRARLP